MDGIALQFSSGSEHSGAARSGRVEMKKEKIRPGLLIETGKKGDPSPSCNWLIGGVYLH
jgi:hypothetical protein